MSTPKDQHTPGPELVSGHYCYYVPEDQDAERQGGYVPSVVIRDEAGHYPMMGNGPCASPWVWGPTLKDAQQTADRMNLRLGLSLLEATKIIASSMRQSMRGRRAVRV